MADHHNSRRQVQSPGELALPQLLAFYQDVIDEDLGTTIGWQTVAWGLVLPDGSALSVPVDGPTAVTLWQSAADAADGLGAYVDTPNPQPRRISPPTAEQARASATFSLRSSDGIAAQPACPVQPSTDEGDRGRPLGNRRPAGTGDTATQAPAS